MSATTSSASAYTSNPSTNLSTLAGAAPGKLPIGSSAAATQTSAAPAAGTGTGTGTGTTTVINNDPRKTSGGRTNGLAHPTTSSSPSPARSPSPGSVQSSNQQPAWHSDTQTIVTSNTHIPSSHPGMNPLSLTPELNDQLTRSYLPSHTGNQWIADLVARMESARLTIDKRAAEQQQHITEEATAKVNALMAQHKQQQDALMKSSRSRAQEIDNEFMKKREAALHQLEHQKGSMIAALEQDLLQQQQKLADNTQKEIEKVAEEARQKKLAVKEEAQHQADQLGGVPSNIHIPILNNTNHSTANSTTETHKVPQSTSVTTVKH